MTTLRCFIAIELTPDVRRSLAALSRQLQSRPGQEGLRWVRPDSIHLTLEFLGDLPEGQVAGVSDLLDGVASAHPAFGLRIAGLGFFPDVRRPRVLWVGVEEPTGSLVRLQADLHRGCAELGLRVDERPYSPHLTLGRVRREAGQGVVSFARDLLANSARQIVGEMTAQDIHLFRSDLRPEGAAYTRLHSTPLDGSKA